MALPRVQKAYVRLSHLTLSSSCNCRIALLLQQLSALCTKLAKQEKLLLRSWTGLSQFLHQPQCWLHLRQLLLKPFAADGLENFCSAGHMQGDMTQMPNSIRAVL